MSEGQPPLRHASWTWEIDHHSPSAKHSSTAGSAFNPVESVRRHRLVHERRKPRNRLLNLLEISDHPIPSSFRVRQRENPGQKYRPPCFPATLPLTQQAQPATPLIFRQAAHPLRRVPHDVFHLGSSQRLGPSPERQTKWRAPSRATATGSGRRRKVVHANLPTRRSCSPSLGGEVAGRTGPVAARLESAEGAQDADGEEPEPGGARRGGVPGASEGVAQGGLAVPRRAGARARDGAPHRHDSPTSLVGHRLRGRNHRLARRARQVRLRAHHAGDRRGARCAEGDARSPWPGRLQCCPPRGTRWRLWVPPGCTLGGRRPS